MAAERTVEEYFADKVHEGLTTGKIHLPLPSGSELLIQWYWMEDGECLSGCRDLGPIGQIHQRGCPLIPALREYYS